MKRFLILLTLLISISYRIGFPQQLVSHAYEKAIGRSFRPAGLQNSPWPKFRSNPQNTGMGQGGGSNGIVKWIFDSGFRAGSTFAVSSDGTIYVRVENGSLFALDPKGVQKASRSIGVGYSEPTIGSDGTVYVGDQDGILWALNADLTLKWSWQDPNHFVDYGTIDSGVSIAPDGTIYVALSDGLYALGPDHKAKWQLSWFPAIFSTPAIGRDGTVFWALGTDLRATNPDGTQRWKLTLTGILRGSPSIGVDGTIYVGNTNGNLYAVNVDGTPRWTFGSGTKIISSPAIAPDGTIYFGTYDPSSSYLYAVNPDGTLKWKYFLGVATGSSPTISQDGTIYIGSGGTLFAINPDGTLQWSLPNTYGDEPVIGSDGTVFVSDYSSGKVFAVGTQVNTVPISSLSISPSAVPEGSTATGTVTLASAAPAGGDVVSLLSSDPSAVVPGVVYVAGGKTTATFTIQTKSVPNTVTDIITATSGGVNRTASITIQSGIKSLSLNPANLLGGASSTGTITLAAPAPTGGLVVNLTSDSSSATVPASVTVAAGATTATFSVTTTSVSSQTVAKITGTTGAGAASASLTLQPLSLTIAAPLQIVGGNVPNPGVVTIGVAAPVGGVLVNLSASSSEITLPASVTILAGATSANFSIGSKGVDTSKSVTLTASSGTSSKSCSITVLPASTVSSVPLYPSVVAGDSSTTVTAVVYLNGAAGPSGTVVNLSSSKPSAANVPATVKVLAGTSSVNVIVSHFAVASTQSVTISAKLGTSSASSVLTVSSIALASVSTPKTAQIVGGNTPGPGLVTLTGNAPTGGLVVNLKSSDPSVVVPSSVTVSAGSSSASFVVTTKGVDTSTPVTITATLGSVTKTSPITILPAVLFDLALSPSSVSGGSPTVVTATLRLNGQTGASGASVNLSSSNTSAASVPATLAIGATQRAGTFVVTQHPVGSTQTVTITATFRSTTVTATLTVNP